MELEFLNEFVDFLKLLNIHLNHFPNHEKYALSQRIRNNAYEVWDLMSEGRKRYYKKTTLTNLDIAFERLRLNIYLAYQLGYLGYSKGAKSEEVFLGDERYAKLNIRLDVIGKRIGAWIKRVKQDEKW